MNQRLGFGVFLAPHHPIGEHPTLQLQRDLELAEILDEYQYDEFWVGEHHSGGWETIASPEMFLAAAAQRTQRIKLGTGVVSVPYRPANPALRDLLVRGHAQLDPLEIGLDVTADGAIVDGSGRASPRLFALGPLARAAFWEITAIPEIRAQCARLADRLHGARLRRAG